MKRLFSTETPISKPRRIEQTRKHPLDNIKSQPALVTTQDVTYDINFYKNAPVNEFLTQSHAIEASYERLIQHIRNGELKDDDLLFITSWVQYKTSHDNYDNLINNWLAEINSILRNATVKIDQEYSHKLFLALTPYLSSNDRVLSDLVQSLNIRELPVRARIRNIDNILSSISKQVDQANINDLQEAIKSLSTVYDLALDSEIAKDYKTAYLKSLTDKLMLTYINNFKTDELKDKFAHLVDLIAKVVSNNDLKLNNYFSGPHLILFTVYYHSTRAFSLDATYELSDKAIDNLVEYYDRYENSVEFRSIISLLFEEEYNYNDIKAEYNKADLESIYKNFKGKLELFTKFRKTVANKLDNHSLPLYINSHFAYKNNQLEYFIENEQSLGRQSQSFMTNKIMFNYLSCVLYNLNEKEQFAHVKHSFAHELNTLTNTDADILNMVLKSKLGKKDVAEDYKRVIIEPVAKERLKHKLAMALKSVAIEYELPDVNIRLDIIDAFIKDLDNHKHVKDQILYHSERSQDLLQGLIKFFHVNEATYKSSLAKSITHIEMERALEMFFSLGERDQAFLEDGRIIDSKIFKEFIQKALVKTIVTIESTVENEEEEVGKIYVDEKEQELQNYNYFDKFMNFKFFDVEARHESSLIKPIESFKKDVQSEQLKLRLWAWVLKNLNYSNLEARNSFYIKDYKMSSLAEKIAELGVKTNDMGIKRLSLDYLTLTQTNFNSQVVQAEVESIGVIDNGVFYTTVDAQKIKKARLAVECNLSGMEYDKIPKELRLLVDECQAAKITLKGTRSD